MRSLTAVLTAALVLLPAGPAWAAGQPPVVVDDAVDIQSVPGIDFRIDALANDSDPDGDTLAYTAATTASLGITSIQGGRLFYRPILGMSGPDTFTYTVSDGQGNTASGTVTVTLWADLPAPGSLVMSSADTGSATIAWPAATNAVAYQIFRNTLLVGTTADLTWTDTGLLSDRQYGYRIASVNGGGFGGRQSAAVVYRQPQKRTPVGLAVAVTDDPTTLSLTWTSAESGPWSVYRDGTLVASSPTRSFTDTGLVTGREYSYQVQTPGFSSSTSVTPSSALSASVTATPAVVTDIGRFFRDHPGTLGAVTVPERAIPGGRQQDHQNGVIVQQDGKTPWAVTGTLAAAWIGAAEDLGFPIGAQESGLRDEGIGQFFEYGSIWDSLSTPPVVVPWFIEDNWGASGWEDGPLGYPVGDLVEWEDGYEQAFEGGGVYWSAVTGARAVDGPMNDRYQADGGTGGALGYPTREAVCGLRGGGCGQSFEAGYIHWSPTTGARITSGPILTTWSRAGWQNGALGYPTMDAKCGLRGGGCGQSFQGGYIHWSPATGAQIITGRILTTWSRAGWQNGALGYPTRAAVCGLRGGGCGQSFQGGYIHWSPATGAQITTGPILTTWSRAGWQNGALGYPTRAAVCGLRGGGCGQSFQGGYIHWSPATGAQITTGVILATWSRAGWQNGRLGYPTGAATVSGGVTRQTFQGGSITVRSGKATVTYR